MSNLRFIIILFLIVTFSYSLTKGQEVTKIYHQFSQDGSYPIIEKFNVKDTIDLKLLIEESYDNLNRVVSIKFLNEGKIKEIYPMYGVSYITFEYGDNFVIERYFDSNRNPLTLFDDESPSYRKYYLNTNNCIDSCKTFFYIEVGALTKEKILTIEKSLKLWKELMFQESSVVDKNDSSSCSNCDMDYIYGYKYSYIKMNGIFPKKKEYEFKYRDFKLIYSKSILSEFIKKY